MGMRLRTGFDHILDWVKTEFFSFRYAQAGARHLKIKDAEHGGTRNTVKSNILATDIIRHSPAAPVGPQGQCCDG